MNNNIAPNYGFVHIKFKFSWLHIAIVYTNLLKGGFTTILMPCSRSNSNVLSKMEKLNNYNKNQSPNTKVM